MSIQSISQAFPVFNDIDGQPLENGFIYIGTAGLAAATNQITVYWDAALTTPATQPIRTTGGYPMNSGSPGMLYTGVDDYSIAVNNKNNSAVTSSLNVTARVSDSLIKFTSSETGAVARTLESKLSDSVSVKDFGATGDGATDDSAAIQLALSSGAKKVIFPKGVYLCASSLTYTNSSNSTMILEGASTTNWTTDTDGSVIKYTGSSYALRLNGNSSPIHTEVRNLTFLGTSSATTGLQIFEAWFVKVRNCTFKSFSTGNGINLTFNAGTAYTGITDIEGCAFNNNSNAIIADKFDTNVLNVLRNQFTANTKCVVMGTVAGATSSRNINIKGNTFDGNTGEIYSYGGAQGWNINENYFERITIGTEPCVTLTTNGSSGINSGAIIAGNTFSVDLAAGMEYVLANFVDGFYFFGNYSAYGDQTDRFSVRFTNITSSNYVMTAATSPSGVVPFPYSFNGSTITGGAYDDYTPAFGGGATFGAPVVAVGSYTKVGRLVTANVFIASSGAPTGSTGSTLTVSLPPGLAVRTKTSLVCCGTIGYTTSWGTTPDYVSVSSAGTAVSFGVKGTGPQLTAADLAGGYIQFSITYESV